MKQIIKQLLAVAILLSATLPSWAYDFSVDGIYYGKNGDGITVYVTYKDNFYFNSYSGSVVVPSTVTYSGTTYNVTSIGYDAFYNCSGLKSVTIPNSVTKIGGSAFEGCYGLTSVTIPNSVTSIGASAFSGTAWFKNQPDGLVYAGKVAYKYKGTMPENTSITIKDGTLGIAESAFSGCSGLTSVTIPNSVTSIGSSAFSGTAWYNNQTDGLVYAGKVAYKYKGTMPDNTSITIKDGTLGIANSAFSGCSGLTSVTIPNSVTSIDKSAFRGCSGLTSVTIPNSVTEIGGGAFGGCSGLTSVTIPNSVTSIGSEAFRECSGLTSVTIGNSVTSIGNYAFLDCYGLKQLTIQDGTSTLSLGYNSSSSSLGEGLFYDAPLESVYLGRNLSYDTSNSCGYSPFYDIDTIKELTIGNSVTSIGSNAFRGCSGLTSVTIPNSVTSIGERAFYYCSGLTSVTIPNSVTSIGGSAFIYCSNLQLVRLDATIGTAPDKVVFGSYKSLTFIVGDNVKSIPKNIVANGNMSSRVANVVALADTPPTATSETFDSYVTSNATLYVKKNSVSKYALADGWGDFNNIQSFGNTITNISIDKTSINIGVGETIQLKATVQPTDATLTDVIWTSSNSCVSVDEKGNVIGQSVGQSVVTAEAIDGSGVKAECVVNVGIVLAQSISLSQKEVTMDVNGLTKLSYTILPENVTIKDVEWSSSNTSVADFKENTDKTIRVVGINTGIAYITARTTDGTNLSATCVFYVGDSGAETIDSDSVCVTVAGGAIRVEGAEGAEAEVYSLSGALLYRGTDSTIALPHGVYIVKVAGTTTKVIL